jgi:hypothetical protein
MAQNHLRNPKNFSNKLTDYLFVGYTGPLVPRPDILKPTSGSMSAQNRFEGLEPPPLFVSRGLLPILLFYLGVSHFTISLRMKSSIPEQALHQHRKNKRCQCHGYYICLSDYTYDHTCRQSI